MAFMLKSGQTRMKRISAIVRKEISNLISDKIAILILFIIPVVMISIVGGSKVRSDLTDCTIWVIDQDNSTTSRKFLKTVTNSSMMGDALKSTFYVTGDTAPVEPGFGQDNATAEVNEENAIKTLPTKYLNAYIIVPEGFEEDLADDGKCKIFVYYNAIDFTARYIADAVILLGLTNVQLTDLMFERDVYFFPEFRPSSFAESINLLELGAPIFVGLMLFFSINLICTQCIVGDIPLQRLLTTPVYRSEVITGKVLAYTIMGVIQIICSLLLLDYFKVTMHCLWIDLFFLFLLNTIASVCMGVFISTISKTRLQASQLFLMFFFVLLIMTYYVRNPIFLALNPMEQTRVAFSQLAFRGDSLLNIAPNLGYIIMTALVFYTMTIIYIKYMKKEFV